MARGHLVHLSATTVAATNNPGGPAGIGADTATATSRSSASSVVSIAPSTIAAVLAATPTTPKRSESKKLCVCGNDSAVAMTPAAPTLLTAVTVHASARCGRHCSTTAALDVATT